MISSLKPRAVRSVACSLAGAALLATGATSPASAHGPIRTERAGALSEQRLRALETQVLGAEHAAEHASQRVAERDPRTRRRVARQARAARVASLRARASAVPSQDGQWAAPFTIPNVAIHAAVLPTGKVMWFSRPPANPSGSQVSLWDPDSGSMKKIDPPRLGADPANIFCASQGFLPDGRLLVMGGNLADPNAAAGTDFKGLKTVYTYNPFNETWTRQPDMEKGRWYPTQVLLADGRVMVMGGMDETGVIGAPRNPDVEVFVPSPDMDGVGTVTKIATRGGAGQPPNGGLYPHLFVMPSGRTLVAGPRPDDSWFVNSLGTGNVFSWQDVRDPSSHSYGGGVILPSDTPGSTKVALIGGNVASGVKNEVFDEADPAAGWVSTPPLGVPRGHLNTVILPDGSMVAVGGGKGEVNGDKTQFVPDNLKVELYDPADQTWRRGAAQVEGRAYHSTAVLLPDARVVSAGDDTNGGRETDTAEIYSPPYLFKGPRPVIGPVPATAGYGQRFEVGFSGSDVAKAVLVAPGATTHANDMNQRYVPLSITGRADRSVTVSAPANANLAPPGHYMLFLVNAAGVPSVAKFVRIGKASGTGGGTVPPAGGGTGGGAVPPAGGGTGGGTSGGSATGGSGTGGTVAPPGSAGPVAPGSNPPATPASKALVTSLKVVRQTLRSTLARGLRVGVGCSRACTIRAELAIEGKLALRLKLPLARGSARGVIGRGSLKLSRALNGRLLVRLTPAAKKRLARMGAVRVRLQLSAKSPTGSAQVVIRTLTLRGGR